MSFSFSTYGDGLSIFFSQVNACCFPPSYHTPWLSRAWWRRTRGRRLLTTAEGCLCDREWRIVPRRNFDGKYYHQAFRAIDLPVFYGSVLWALKCVSISGCVKFDSVLSSVRNVRFDSQLMGMIRNSEKWKENPSSENCVLQWPTIDKAERWLLNISPLVDG